MQDASIGIMNPAGPADDGSTPSPADRPAIPSDPPGDGWVFSAMGSGGVAGAGLSFIATLNSSFRDTGLFVVGAIILVGWGSFQAITAAVVVKDENQVGWEWVSRLMTVAVSAGAFGYALVAAWDKTPSASAWTVFGFIAFMALALAVAVARTRYVKRHVGSSSAPDQGNDA